MVPGAQCSRPPPSTASPFLGTDGQAGQWHRRRHHSGRPGDRLAPPAAATYPANMPGASTEHLADRQGGLSGLPQLPRAHAGSLGACITPVAAASRRLGDPGPVPPLPAAPRSARPPRARSSARRARSRVVRSSAGCSAALRRTVSAFVLLGVGLPLVEVHDVHQQRAAPERLRRSRQHKPDANDIDGKDQNILIVGNDDRSDMTDAEVHASCTPAATAAA